MKKIIVIIILLTFFLSVRIWAQCPVSISITSISVVTATCPSNGGFSINATVGSGAVYEITSGPAGYPASIQSSNVFSGLLPGSYTVKVACAVDPSISTTTTINIPSSYIQIAANSVISNICTGSGPGGTINTTVTAGSSATYSYAYWQGDPAIADVSLTYQVNNTASLTNTFSAASFGTYNVRVKDACGVFVTQQVTIAKIYPENFCITDANPKFSNLTCAQLIDSIRLQLIFNVNTRTLPAQGFDVLVYENTGNCTSQVKGALTKTIHLTKDDESAPEIMVPNFKNLLLVLKTPCGDSCTYCYTYNAIDQKVNINLSFVSDGCVAAGDPITYSLKVSGGINYILPVTLVIKNSAGVNIPGSPYIATTDAALDTTFKNLAADTYTITATDACGRSNILTTNPPATGTPNDLHITYHEEKVNCSTIEGRTYFLIAVGGVMANFTNTTATVIAPSPNLVGVQGDGTGGYYSWINAIPGGTYYIEVANGCGQKDTVSLTLPLNAPVLNQHTNVTVEQLCGSGMGNIIVEATNNGYGTFSYEVKNSASTIVGTGTTPGGTYSNLPAGNYTVTSHIVGCGPYDYSSQVTIAPAGAGPVISKKSGVKCEDASGNPASTGKALFAFTGAAPLKVDYKRSSESDTAYINFTNSATSSATITGLDGDSTYTVRITDNCGNSNVTEVLIGRLNPVTTENNSQPCVGNAYTLSVPDLIDATYAWEKNGILFSTQRSIHFNSYNSGDNGTYVCTIVIAGCVTRIVTTTLNSALCGSTVILPVKLSGFTARTDNCATKLNWKITDAPSLRSIDIERSTNSRDYTIIANTRADATGNYTDESIFEGVIYYRLKMNGIDGRYGYSEPLIVKTNCNSANTQWVRYPTLIKPGESLTIKLNTSNSISTKMRIIITSVTGQHVYTQEIAAHRGQNMYTLPGLMLAQGTYLVCVYDSYLLRIGSAQKLIVTK